MAKEFFPENGAAQIDQLLPRGGQSLVWNAPIGICTSTPQGRYLSVNPAFARMLWYDSPQEMIASITLDAAYCRDHPGAVPGGYVLLTVSDTGCGMSKEVQLNVEKVLRSAAPLSQAVQKPRWTAPACALHLSACVHAQAGADRQKKLSGHVLCPALRAATCAYIVDLLSSQIRPRPKRS